MSPASRPTGRYSSSRRRKLLSRCGCFSTQETPISELCAAPERQALGGMPKGSSADQMAAFGKWRNFHFSHAVRDAAAKGVRYAGMGLEHLKYLRAEGLPPKSADYDMVAKNLIDFETLTKNLAASAKSP